MQSIADGLPPEIAQQIHPDWRRNEQEYWADRDQLISKYRNRWIAFANGSVVASGTSAVEVFHAADQSGLHPYVTCVGREHEPCRMRRAAGWLGSSLRAPSGMSAKRDCNDVLGDRRLDPGHPDRELCDRACAALDPLCPRAERLRELARFVVERDR